MARIEPLSDESLELSAPAIYRMLDMVGYVPNAMATVARKPDVLAALLPLVEVVMRGPGRLTPGFRFLIAYVASETVGCRYSAVHSVHAAEHLGESSERVRAVASWRDSALFSDAERTLFALAAAAAPLPSRAEQRHFDTAREYHDDDLLVEVMTVVALFGWFNRWNTALASQLEELPHRAVQALMGEGWPERAGESSGQV